MLKRGVWCVLLLLLAEVAAGQTTVSGSGTWSGSWTLSAEVETEPLGDDENRYVNPDGSWIGPRYDEKAELPRLGYYTDLSATPSNGTVRTVTAGSYSDLVAKINAAQCGDVVVIPAKNGASQAVYAGGTISLNRVCDEDHYITIRTDQVSALPPEGTRISPAWAGVTSLPGRPAFSQPTTAGIYLPKIMRNASGSSVFDGSAGAFYRLIGLEATVDCTQTTLNYGTLFALSSTSATTGNHIILDRMWIHGCELPNAPAITGAPMQVYRGVSVSGSYLAIINSYLNDFYTTNISNTTESQAISGGGGDIPQQAIKIVNNFLESAGECGMFGGGAATVNPTDIEIRRNHCYKPLQWRCDPAVGCPGNGDHVIIKNASIELKNAVRVLFEGNINENSWNAPSASGASQGDQKGFAILMTPKNQNGQCPLCAVTDITYRYGITKHSANGIQTGAAASDSGDFSLGSARISIHDYVFDDINVSWAGGDTTQQMGSCMQTSAHPATPAAGQGVDLTYKHNTCIVSGGQRYGGLMWTIIYDPANPEDLRRRVVKDNIGPAPMWYLDPSTNRYNGVIDYMNSINPSHDWCVQGNLITTGNWANQQVNNPWPQPADQPANGECPTGAEPNVVAGAYSTLGFVNFNGGNGGNYRLTASSPYKGMASDGKDPGADIDEIEEIMSGASSTHLPYLSPASVDFGTQTVGTPSAGRTITCYNDSDSAVPIDLIYTSGDFSQTNNCGNSLAAHSSCAMVVVFNPTQANTRNGQLMVETDLGNYSSSLTGVGQSAVPQISVSAPSLDFGTIVVNTSSGEQTVTLTNVGTANASGFAVSLVTGTHYTRTGTTNTCTGATLTPTQSCTVGVKFYPTTTGTLNDTLRITDNSSTSPHNISLTGTSASQPTGPVTIYPAIDTIPQGTKLPLMCDPGPCTYTFAPGSSTVGTLSANGNYTAPNSNGQVTIRATQGANHADAIITISGTLPAMQGDCATAPYTKRDPLQNVCSFNNPQIGGTAVRKFVVTIPSGSHYVPGQSGLIINTGRSGHGADNWCSAANNLVAGNEHTGWWPYIKTAPDPQPVYICMEGSWAAAGSHPEVWNYWGQATVDYAYCNGATPCSPDEGAAAGRMIRAVVRDLNLDPRKVFIVNDWDASPPLEIAVQNSDIVAGAGLWQDIFFLGSGADKVVDNGPYAGYSIPFPAVPISYVGLASRLGASASPGPNMLSMCTTNSGNHLLNNDDIWDYLAAGIGITNPSCGVTGSSLTACSNVAAANQKFCTGSYDANGVGTATSLEAKTGIGKAGTGVMILKMVGNASRTLPYTELGWSGEDFTTTEGSVLLDMSNTACNSPSPCNHFGNQILGNTGRYGTISARYKWFFGVNGVSGGHGKQ